MAQTRVSLKTPAEKLNFLASQMKDLFPTTPSFGSQINLDSDHLKEILALLIFKATYILEDHFKEAHVHTVCNGSMLDLLILKARWDLLEIVKDIYEEKFAELLKNGIPSRRLSFYRALSELKIHFASARDKSTWEQGIIKYYLDLFNKYLKAIPFDISTPPLNINNILEKLFGKKTDYLALEVASAKVIQLFSHPAKYTTYLQYIEHEFNRYNLKHFGKPFPKMSPNKYEFKLIDGYEYPIPNENFGDGMTKFSMLQEFLMIFLRQAGWGKQNKALQWVGFIPNEIANQLLLEDVGAFVTEGRLNEGLFHGKLSHMLQFALIAVAIKDNFISNVSLHEIIDFVVHQKIYETEKTLWQQMFDWTGLDPVSLSNPYVLHTFIMRYGHGELATPSLATYMIDTFCNGFNRLIELEFKNRNEINKNIFLDALQYQALSLFSISPEKLEAYIKQYKSASLESITSSGSRYFVIEKKYKPKSLVLSSFQLFATEQSQKLNNQETTANTAIKKNHTSMM